jgi:hypothetical protein
LVIMARANSLSLILRRLDEIERKLDRTLQSGFSNCCSLRRSNRQSSMVGGRIRLLGA